MRLKGLEKEMKLPKPFKCEDHPEKEVEYYSLKESKFVCSHCVFMKKLTPEDTIICSMKDIEKQADFLS